MILTNNESITVKSKFLKGTMIRILRDHAYSRQNKGTIGKVHNIEPKIRDNKLQLNYSILFGDDAWDGFCENDLEKADVDKFYEYRHRVQSGHIIMLNDSKCIVEHAHYKQEYISGSRMGSAEYENVWFVQARELKDDGSYDPQGKVHEFNQGEDIVIIGRMKMNFNQ